MGDAVLTWLWSTTAAAWQQPTARLPLKLKLTINPRFVIPLPPVLHYKRSVSTSRQLFGTPPLALAPQYLNSTHPAAASTAVFEPASEMNASFQALLLLSCLLGSALASEVSACALPLSRFGGSHNPRQLTDHLALLAPSESCLLSLLNHHLHLSAGVQPAGGT